MNLRFSPLRLCRGARELVFRRSSVSLTPAPLSHATASRGEGNGLRCHPLAQQNSAATSDTLLPQRGLRAKKCQSTL